MAKKLSDTASVILSTAAARDNLHVLPLPPLKAPMVATRKTIISILADGLIAEIPATSQDEAWGVDADDGRKTLVVTDDGLRAIGIEAEAPTTTKKSTAKNKTRQKAPMLAHTAPTSAKSRARGAKAAKKTPAPRAAAKAPTKQEIVVGMLRRANGASVAELAKATDWQPHSVRGVLTATIKGRLGLPLISEKGEDGIRRYYVAPISTAKGKAS